MTDAPKIDTKAPERIWANGLGCYGPDDLGGAPYIRADLADARAAAAARRALEQAAIMAELGILSIDGGQAAVEICSIPVDTDALDRLIAERVREAVEATWGEAIAIVAEYDFERLAHDLIRRMEVARGSKEGRDG